MVKNGLLGGCLDAGGGMSLQGVDRPQGVTENDEETQREECSSTESTHQEVVDTFQCGEDEGDCSICVVPLCFSCTSAHSVKTC